MYGNDAPSPVKKTRYARKIRRPAATPGQREERADAGSEGGASGSGSLSISRVGPKRTASDRSAGPSSRSSSVSVLPSATDTYSGSARGSSERTARIISRSASADR